MSMSYCEEISELRTAPPLPRHNTRGYPFATAVRRLASSAECAIIAMRDFVVSLYMHLHREMVSVPLKAKNNYHFAKADVAFNNVSLDHDVIDVSVTQPLSFSKLSNTPLTKPA
ncbi:hypothetical protein HPB52_004782 [Rhipicephalus sanguineus]|uniref:Uncharacterized protein n=1 Tax=Rhipicephalus sanguineus TaxID=34632 RepID=A0A9D4SNP2_RHISA|nr:hypothetical protein HPB52_004782 [Rhipicephalus sanguineus]